MSDPARVGRSETSDRYTVERVDAHTWGGVQWAIWDHELGTWADDLGRWLTEDAAREAICREVER